MPNIEALQNAEKRRDQERAALSTAKQLIVNDSAKLERYEKMQLIFKQEGWQLLREVFLAQHAEELIVLLDGTSPLSDVELRVLQAQLQTSDRIIRLDEYVADRIESLRNKINAAKSGTDGSPKAA